MRLVWLMLAPLAACNGAVVQAFPDQFVGVGLELTIRDNQPTVVRALEGGPAEEAGLKKEDKLVQINGEPTDGMPLPDVVLKLRGETGSTVNVVVVRDGTRVATNLVRHPIAKHGDDYVARTQ